MRARTPVHRAGDQSDQSVRNHDPPHRQRDDHDTEQVNGVLRDENRHGDVLDSVFDVLSPAIVCRARFIPSEAGSQGLAGTRSGASTRLGNAPAPPASPIGPAAAVEGRRGRITGPVDFPIWRSERHTAGADAGAYPESRRRPAAGYFAAFFLRAAQEAFIRSDTASFSLAVIGRRFLVGVASDAVSATGVATAAGRCEEERRAAGFAGAEAPRILSTSSNALISACRRSISLCRSAIAFAMTLMSFPGAVSSVGRHALGSAERVPMGSDSSPTSVRRPDGARRSQLRWVGTPTMVTKSTPGARRRAQLASARGRRVPS